MRAHGKLLVIEGPDGVGKTTLAQAVVAELVGLGVGAEYFSFPGRAEGTLGHLVYRIHHENEDFGIPRPRPLPLQVLHVSAHIDAIESTLKPTLKRGRWVVLDRYWWSTWVYGRLSGVSIDLLDALIDFEKRCWGAILPHMVALIMREKPFRRERANRNWSALVEQYRLLAKREEANCSVRVIENDRTIPMVATEIATLALDAKLAGGTGVEDRSFRRSDPSQLTLGLQRLAVTPPARAHGMIVSAPHAIGLRSSEVFDAYWWLAAERQAIFFRRFRGAPPPWTNDPILQQHKFTNAYRASDRVSQYLIRHVIYEGDQSPAEVFFRTILFKLFNRVDTWRLLVEKFGHISYREYERRRYDRVLSGAIGCGQQIYSAAYIMPPLRGTGMARKHQGHLLLLERMMDDELPDRLTEARSLREVFELLKAYPMMGDFLAYQYAIDLNYGPLMNFSEMEFIVPGPGARRGIEKCFPSLGGLSESDVIRLVTDAQQAEFERRDLCFESLWGRPLQLVDCQNLFCEVDKYARVAFPGLQVSGGGKRIKQKYRETRGMLEYWYPPKWGLNQKIAREREDRQ